MKRSTRTTEHSTIASIRNSRSLYPITEKNITDSPAKANTLQDKPYLIDEVARLDNSPETERLIQQNRKIVKPGKFIKSGDKWKKIDEPKSLPSEKLQIEEKHWMIIKHRLGRTEVDPNDPRYFLGEFIPQKYSRT